MGPLKLHHDYNDHREKKSTQRNEWLSLQVHHLHKNERKNSSDKK